MKRVRIIQLVFFLTLFSCVILKKKVFDLTKVPPHFPKMEFEENNKFTKARWGLGKKYFLILFCL